MMIPATSVRNRFGAVGRSGSEYSAGGHGEPTGLATSRHRHIVRAWHATAADRDAVHDSPSSTIAGNDLGQALAALGDELASTNSMKFSLEMEGKPRALPPILQNEICRIACELLRNAFRHPRARQIEAEIRYGARLLRLRIRDDGRGIAPNDLEEGYREWRGISEYVKRIGARLDFWVGPKPARKLS